MSTGLDTPNTPNTPNTGGTLSRHYRDWPERPATFVDLAPGAPLASYLHNAPADVRQIYVTGGWDAASTPPHEWWKAPAQEGWKVTYRPAEKSSGRSGDYTCEGRTIAVRMSATWFDRLAPSVDVARAYAALRRMLRATFDPSVSLMGTPARTGNDLLERTLPQYREEGASRAASPRPYDYLATPDYLQELIRENYGQGRMEWCAPAEVETVRTMAVYDARWMYAACMRHLPVAFSHAPLVHDFGSEFAGPYVPGFYRVVFRVPPEWPYIGLLGYYDEDADKTRYPRTGADAWEGWTTSPELALARQNGWRVRIVERILYAPDRTPGSDPARRWIENLQAARLRAAANPAYGEPVTTALRHLVLDPCGSWWSMGSREVGITEPEGHVPDDALTVSPVYERDSLGRVVRLLRIEWTRQLPRSPALAAFSRPEWSAMVWGRARALLAGFALSLPPAAVIGLRHDAVIVRTEGDHGQWPHVPADTGRPGAFRVKPGGQVVLAESMPTPRGEPAQAEPMWQEILRVSGGHE